MLRDKKKKAFYYLYFIWNKTHWPLTLSYLSAIVMNAKLRQMQVQTSTEAMQTKPEIVRQGQKTNQTINKQSRQD